MNLTNEEIAWAAGLFEGEGYVGQSRPGTAVFTVPRVSLNSTDRDVVERFAEVIGVGAVNEVPRPKAAEPHHKTQWRWETRRAAEVIEALGLMRPWLCARRGAKADLVLKTIRTERTRSCLRCSKVFLANDSRRVYCSKICGDSVRIRRWFDRDPEHARELGRERTRRFEARRRLAA